MTATAASPRNSLERLTLQSDSLRAVVLPQLGGKIASLALLPWGGRRGGPLLQGPLKPYLLRTSAQTFDESDASGWDECLPSIQPCQVSCGGEPAVVPDHGEAWRLPWKVEEHTDELVRMSATGTVVPLYWERTLELEGSKVILEYLLRNPSKVPLPYAWAAHPLFAVEPGDRIILPHSVEEVEALSSANARLSPGKHAWPFTADARDGSAIDLTTVGQPTDGVGDMLVLTAPEEGWAAIDRRTMGHRLTLRFDPKDSPWLGVWICYGGWPAAAAARKGFTVAVEPSTTSSGNLATAIDRGEARTLAPGEEQRWQLLLEVTQLDKGRGRGV